MSGRISFVLETNTVGRPKDRITVLRILGGMFLSVLITGKDWTKITLPPEKNWKLSPTHEQEGE